MTCCNKDTLQPHIKDRLRRRRIWAGVAAWIILIGGPLLIGLGLTSDQMAARLSLLMPVLATFVTPIAAIVCTYLGVGSYEIGQTIKANGGSVKSEPIPNPEGSE